MLSFSKRDVALAASGLHDFSRLPLSKSQWFESFPFSWLPFTAGKLLLRLLLLVELEVEESLCPLPSLVTLSPAFLAALWVTPDGRLLRDTPGDGDFFVPF